MYVVIHAKIGVTISKQASDFRPEAVCLSTTISHNIKILFFFNELLYRTHTQYKKALIRMCKFSGWSAAFYLSAAKSGCRMF